MDSSTKTGSQELTQRKRPRAASMSTTAMETIRRPFTRSLRKPKTAQNEQPIESCSKEMRQKTPPRSWLHKVAAKLTISKREKGALDIGTGKMGRHEGEPAKTLAKRSEFRRKPIPSFIPPPIDEVDQSSIEDMSEATFRSNTSDAATHTSTMLSESIRTPSSAGNTSAGNCDGSIDSHSHGWDFREVEDSDLLPARVSMSMNTTISNDSKTHD